MTARVASLVLTAVVSVYAVAVVRDFYRYVDHSVYLAVDDALANTSYDLAMHGHYGFPVSPTLGRMSRYDGLMNYGPWYFYLGAALIAVFGYSLTLLRSIHLWIIIAAVVAARAWFHDGPRPVFAWAIAAIPALWFFDNTQWPMVRPDSMVTLFALVFVLSAGLAISRRQARWWALAGFSAACGAFTHLIAWTLLPVAVVVWAIASLRAPSRQQFRAAAPGLLALLAGAAAGVVMFYWSFGFRVRDQIAFLNIYRAYVPVVTEQHGGQAAFLPVLRTHWGNAFGLVPTIVRRLGALVPLAGWVMVVRAWRSRDDSRMAALPVVLPPLAVWTAYAISLGSYANFHSGYIVLSQIMAVWSIAAVCSVAARTLPDRTRMVVGTTGCVLLALLTAFLIEEKASASSDRKSRVDSWIAISDYVDAVLRPLPRQSTAWGSIVFGIEHPDRIQLVDFSEATLMTSGAPAHTRAAVAPEFVIWGYVDNRGAPSDVLTGQPSWPQTLAQLFPGAHYRLIALVGAEPYGVTRIFADEGTSIGQWAPPEVAVYDAARRRWSSHVGTPSTARFSAAEPIRVITVRGVEPKIVAATRTVAIELPPGDYLIHATVKTSADPLAARMLVAGPSRVVDLTHSELAPADDLALYRAGDTSVDLLLRHAGGTALISQFDDPSQSALERLQMFPIEGVSASTPAAAAGVAPPADYVKRLLQIAADSGYLIRH